MADSHFLPLIYVGETFRRSTYAFQGRIDTKEPTSTVTKPPSPAGSPAPTGSPPSKGKGASKGKGGKGGTEPPSSKGKGGKGTGPPSSKGKGSKGGKGGKGDKCIGSTNISTQAPAVGDDADGLQCSSFTEVRSCTGVSGCVWDGSSCDAMDDAGGEAFISDWEFANANTCDTQRSSHVGTNSFCSTKVSTDFHCSICKCTFLVRLTCSYLLNCIKGFHDVRNHR